MDRETNRSVKILLVVHSVAWKGGGAFFHALHIAKSLHRQGVSVEIMCTSVSSKFRVIKKEVQGVRLIEFPDLLWGQARNGWDFFNTLRRIIFLVKNNYDIVHLLDTRPVVIFPGLFAKFFKKSKLVIEWLDWFGRGGTASERKTIIRFFMEPIETFFEEKFRRFADASIGLGQPLAERAKEFAPNVPLFTMVHGCDTEVIKEYNKIEVRKELGLNKHVNYIGYTGRMREDVIIRLRELVKELENTKVVLIGNSVLNVDKYLTDEEKSLFIKTGWIDYVLVNKYMSACDVLILPFDSNSVARNGIWPSKINDYLSVGRPIVSTKLEVLSEIFEKKIGIMTEDNVKEIAKACKLLFEDENLAKSCGHNARALAEQEYNWNYISNKLYNFYIELL